MKNLKLVSMIEAAFFAAFAFILDLLPSIQLAPWISISFAMVPIFILAFRWGVKVGLLSGFLWGLLQVVLGNAYYLAPIQFLIEYFLAFAFVGFAGLFYKTIQTHLQSGEKKKALLWVVIATLVGSVARYFWHFVAGVVFWGEYAPGETRGRFCCFPNIFQLVFPVFLPVPSPSLTFLKPFSCINRSNSSYFM